MDRGVVVDGVVVVVGIVVVVVVVFIVVVVGIVVHNDFHVEDVVVVRGHGFTTACF